MQPRACKVLAVAVSLTLLSLSTGAWGTTVGYWRFEGGTGTSVPDSSTSGNTGSFFNSGPSYVGSCDVPLDRIPLTCASNDSALFFDAVDGDAIVVPSSSSIQPANAITIEFWIKYFSLSGRALLGKQYAGCCRNSYQIELNRGTSATTSFNLTDQGGVEHNLEGPAVPRGRWVHVAATWGSSSQEMRLYYDGQLVASEATPTSTSIIYDSNPLLIGGESDTNDPNPQSGFFNGFLDELRISDVALPPSAFLNAPECTSGSLEWGIPLPSKVLVTLLSAHPVIGGSPVDFVVETESPLRLLEIHDVSGRLVRRWSMSELDQRQFSWQPGISGEATVAGIYWIQAEAQDGGRSSRKVILLGR